MGAASKAVQLFLHPTEIGPLARMYLEARRVKKLTQGSEDLQFCYDMLNNVSRSFSIVIQQLPEQLRDAVCVFYLVLRALDTVEDDMAFPDERKLPLLHTFHEKISDPAFSLDDCGEKDYKELLQQYPKVTRVYLGLSGSAREVIKDICKRMGDGMADFIEKEVQTVEDYDQYCHYVAGLVGIGLCHLFAASGCEEARFASDMDDLANHMGLFLQKTNIIRDYLEDILEEPAPRMFWPREIWGKYAERLADLKEPSNRTKAVQCLNHVICNAAQHAPRCLEYMQQLRNPQVFSFCAIPQIMAIATLALCYNNGDVFEGVVKMRRGQTACVFDRLSSMGSLYQQFHEWAALLQDKARQAQAQGDPTAAQTLRDLEPTLAACREGAQMHATPLYAESKTPQVAMLFVALTYLLYALNAGAVRDMLGMPTSGTNAMLDAVQPATAFCILIVSLLKVCW